MKIRNTLLKFLLITTLAVSQSGCGFSKTSKEPDSIPETPSSSPTPATLSDEENYPPETQDPSVNTGSDSEKPQAEQTEAEFPSFSIPELDTNTWQGAYLQYLIGPEFAAYYDLSSFTYSLIYVDEDDIPELVADSGHEAGGCTILTWHDGSMDVMFTDRLYFDYIEKHNLLCNSDGHMGYYYDLIYTVENGKWVCLEEGIITEQHIDENSVGDEGYYDFYFSYEWNGQEVSEQKYFQLLSSVYDEEQAVTPGRYYIFMELCSLLATGDVSSANHRYEFIIEDVTWQEAETRCQERGGYLATITSPEEFSRIEEQLLAEEMTDFVFWIGADREDTYYYHWNEPGLDPQDPVFGTVFKRKTYGDFWDSGYPLHYIVTEAKKLIDMEAVCMFYNSATERYVLRDTYSDPQKWNIEYAGTIGYICEYNN